MAEPQLQSILVVGGEQNLVFGNFERNLRLYGLRVGWHYQKACPPSIPKACRAVVVISDMASSGVVDKARALAASYKVDFCAVPRKWSFAEPILRDRGLITTTLPIGAPVVEDTSKWISSREVADLFEIEVHAVHDLRKSGRLEARLATKTGRVGKPGYEFSEASVERMMTAVAVSGRSALFSVPAAAPRPVLAAVAPAAVAPTPPAPPLVQAPAPAPTPIPATAAAPVRPPVQDPTPTPAPISAPVDAVPAPVVPAFGAWSWYVLSEDGALRTFDDGGLGSGFPSDEAGDTAFKAFAEKNPNAVNGKRFLLLPPASRRYAPRVEIISKVHFDAAAAA